MGVGGEGNYKGWGIAKEEAKTESKPQEGL